MPDHLACCPMWFLGLRLSPRMVYPQVAMPYLPSLVTFYDMQGQNTATCKRTQRVKATRPETEEEPPATKQNNCKHAKEMCQKVPSARERSAGSRVNGLLEKTLCSTEQMNIVRGFC